MAARPSPEDDNGKVGRRESLLGSNVARGGDLFRPPNCASCHNSPARAALPSSGKYAPDLGDAQPAQIYDAMLTGPQNMPRFSDRQLTPEEKRDIIAYVREGGGGDAQLGAPAAQKASAPRPRAWRCGRTGWWP